MQISNLVPLPTWLLTSMFPLNAFTICLTIERPNPVPPDFLERPFSTL